MEMTLRFLRKTVIAVSLKRDVNNGVEWLSVNELLPQYVFVSLH